jgi:hypothetical protein
MVVMDAQSMIYLVMFWHMVNMGLQVEICAREVVWRVNNMRKPMIFYDDLDHLNIIVL